MVLSEISTTKDDNTLTLNGNYMHTMFAKIKKYLVIQQQNKSNLAQFQ